MQLVANVAGPKKLRFVLGIIVVLYFSCRNLYMVVRFRKHDFFTEKTLCFFLDPKSGQKCSSFSFENIQQDLTQYALPIPNVYLNSTASTLKENGDLEEHLLWFQEQRQAALNLTVQEEPLKLFYRTMAGLGHQLNRIAGVYHLSKLYKIPRIYLTSNPVCGGDLSTIYDHLIGQGPLIVTLPFSDLDEVKVPQFPNYTMADPFTMSNESLNSLQCCANIVNDVPGYSSPFKFVDANGARQNEAHINLLVKDFQGKQSTDYELYQQLMMLFKHRHQERLEEVLSNIKFDEHTVFALHIRTGNGEKGDFEVKKRGIKDINNWVDNAIKLLCSYSETYQDYFIEKPLMLFVGTDSGNVVQKLQNASSTACKIPVVSSAQEYPEEGKGVSFEAKYDDKEKCLKGWENMFLDMYIFTLCNTVIAGQYSSFTQAAPLSYIFQKSKTNAALKGIHPHYFCEIGKDGDGLECFDDLKGWMLREKTAFFGNQSFERHDRLVEILFPLLRPEKDVSKRSVPLQTPFAGTALRIHNFAR